VTLIPVLWDCAPAYLEMADDAHRNVLSLPVGGCDLLQLFIDELAQVSPRPPVVLGPFNKAPFNGAELRSVGRPPVRRLGLEALRDPLSEFAMQDTLLIVSAQLVASEPGLLRKFCDTHRDGEGVLRHLLRTPAPSAAPQEFVHAGAEGGVRRIQRYFGPASWQFTSGAMASLVPVTCLLTSTGLDLTSLSSLRTSLNARGVPSRDDPCNEHVFDLHDESGALAFAASRAELLAGKGAHPRGKLSAAAHANGNVAPSARLVGPVVVDPRAVVAEGALIVGPTILGPSVHVEARAEVVQCLVTPGTRIPAGVSLRHQVVVPGVHSALAPTPTQRRHSLPHRTGETTAVSARAKRADYHEIKRWFEAPLAALGLLMAAVLMIPLALLVKLTSRGPVFYGGEREGLDGKRFKCWKFRTMQVNADALQRDLAAVQFADGPQFKIDQDPRLTPIGGRIRAWNLDELPQLWNVLVGEMSFVGPRPSPFHENQVCVPWREARLSVRPGITGLWQVCRRDRTEGDFHQWIQYDLLYVRHASFGADVRIFLHTILSGGGRRATELTTVLPGVGAAELAASERDAVAVARAAASGAGGSNDLSERTAPPGGGRGWWRRSMRGVSG
jgi:lipopolysaccharide/colanic/teichoic acid biosynthesis glycosyltransferase